MQRVVVETAGWLRTGVGADAVEVSLTYDPADPYAVHLAFHLDARGGGETVAWSFARDLLAAGLHQPSGLGDVRIWPWTGPEGETIALALSSPDGQALIEAPRSPLAGFLEAAYGSVPAGREAQHLPDPDRWLRP